MLNLEFSSQQDLMAAYLPFVHDGALTTIVSTQPVLGDSVAVNLSLPGNSSKLQFQANIVLTHKLLDGNYKIGLQLNSEINQLI